MSAKLKLTLPDGSSVTLPSQNDVHRTPPHFCADFPGLGIRDVDTHCLRCAKEAPPTHRRHWRSCSRPCFLCKLVAHPGKICPDMIARVDPWWFRHRGFTGSIPGHSRTPPELPAVTDAVMMSVPPAIVLEALRQNLPNDEYAVLSEAFNGVLALTEVSHRVRSALGSLLASPTESALKKCVLDSSVHLTQVSSEISKSSDCMLHLLTLQLQATVRQVVSGSMVRVARFSTPVKDYNTITPAGAGLMMRRELQEAGVGLRGGALTSEQVYIKQEPDDEVGSAPSSPPGFYFDPTGNLTLSHRSQDQIQYQPLDVRPLGTFSRSASPSPSPFLSIEDGKGTKSSRSAPMETSVPLGYSRRSLQLYHSRPHTPKPMDRVQDEKQTEVGSHKDRMDDLVTANGAEISKLYVGNLPFDTTEEDVRTFFKSYRLKGVTVPLKGRTSMIHGFAFVEMDIPLAARRAIIAFNGRMIRGRKVIVQLARGNPRKQNKREETEDLSAAIDELIQTEQRKASSSLSDNSVTLGKEQLMIENTGIATTKDGKRKRQAEEEHDDDRLPTTPQITRSGSQAPCTGNSKDAAIGVKSVCDWEPRKRPMMHHNADMNYGRLTPPSPSLLEKYENLGETLQEMVTKVAMTVGSPVRVIEGDVITGASDLQGRDKTQEQLVGHAATNDGDLATGHNAVESVEVDIDTSTAIDGAKKCSEGSGQVMPEEGEIVE